MKATEIAVEREELLHKMTDMEEHFMQHIERLEAKISDMSTSLDVAKSEHDHLADRLHQLESKKLSIKEHQQKYLDNVRQCCIELLSLNVGVKQIEPVIKSVLYNIAAMDVDTLPAPSTLTNMLVETKGIACQQLGAILSQEENVTLHSDGTSKYGICILWDFRCQLNQVLIHWGYQKWSLDLQVKHLPHSSKSWEILN